MGALPKNKITRAERGKRRRGNTPTLKRDAKTTSVPLHKQGFVAQLMNFAGFSSASKTSTTAKPKSAKKTKKAA
jgi:hypothetical protein